MPYKIAGLPRDQFKPLFGLDDHQLALHNAIRVKADSDGGYPCRITLEDAKVGESLLLLNHVSLDGRTPFRTAYAIFVRETEREAPLFKDCIPPSLEGRALALRCFDGGGLLVSAELCEPGRVDDSIRRLFGRRDIDEIHAHNPVYGCFLARIERDER